MASEKNQTVTVCSFCPQEFTTISNKNRHERNKHTTLKTISFECKYCYARLTSKSNLARHEIDVHKVKNENEDQDNSHDNKSEVQGVDNRIIKIRIFDENEVIELQGIDNTKVKTICCKFCPQKFTEISHKYRHERIKHANQEQDSRYEDKIENEVNEVHKVDKTKCKTIGCSFCPKKFKQIKNKYRHERIKHSVAGKKSFECTHCSVRLNTKWSKVRHEKKVHDIENPKEVPKTYIQCTECVLFFWAVKDLREHRSSAHHEEMSPIILFFKTFSDFMQWKEKEEYKKQVKYVRRRKDRLGRSTYFCVKGGIYRPEPPERKKEGRKTRKSRGSCKLGYHCTSTIESYHIEDGIMVEYFPNHYGHQLSFLGLCQMKVSKKNEEQIDIESIQTIKDHINKTTMYDEEDSSFSSGGPVNLDSKLYENIPEDVIEEIQKRSRDQGSILTENQDVQNISLDFDLDTLKILHKSDPISSQFIIESLGEEVLYSKQQGVLDKEHPEIMENEFVLIIMTAAQEKLFRECINHSRFLTVSIDSTYGISETDYHATTIMNIENDSLGFPDAVCISSNLSEQILSLYFNKIKDKFGILYANLFMSNGIPMFSTAWTKVMGSSSINNCLICSFYVENAWRKQIEAIRNANQDSKITIYSICCTLLEMKDEQKFWTTASNFMKNLEQGGYVEFKNYFEKSYLHENKVTMWATCFRIGIPVDTNNYLGTLQNILKSVFFDGKKGRRLDKTILGILKLINRKKDPTIKKEKCGITLARSVKEIETGVFSVQSNNCKNSQCFVRRSVKCTICKEKCILCGACSHIYICECESYKSNLCKHVNAVTMYLNAVKKVEPNKLKDSGNENDVIMEEDCDSDDIEELKIQKINKILDIQDEITMQLSDKDFPYHVYSVIEKQLKQVKENLHKLSISD